MHWWMYAFKILLSLVKTRYQSLEKERESILSEKRRLSSSLSEEASNTMEVEEVWFSWLFASCYRINIAKEWKYCKRNEPRLNHSWRIFILKYFFSISTTLGREIILQCSVAPFSSGTSADRSKRRQYSRWTTQKRILNEWTQFAPCISLSFSLSLFLGRDQQITRIVVWSSDSFSFRSWWDDITS